MFPSHTAALGSDYKIPLGLCLVLNAPIKCFLYTELSAQDAKTLPGFPPSFLSFLSSFLFFLLTLIDHILCDRDVIGTLCLFFFKPHNSPLRYIFFLDEKILFMIISGEDKLPARTLSKRAALCWPVLSFSH